MAQVDEGSNPPSQAEKNAAAGQAAEQAAIDQYNAEITARWGAGVLGGQDADNLESVGNTVAQNAAIEQENVRAQQANVPIVAQDAQNATKWYSTLAQQATTKQNYQNTLTATNAGGGSLETTVDTLVSQGGFSQADATSLANWYQDQINNSVPAATIEEQLYDQPAVKALYPAISQMQAKGIPPIGISDYIAVKNAVAGMSQALGIPAPPADVLTNAIVNRVPISGSNSIEERLTAAHTWASNAIAGNPGAFDYLQQNFGVSKSDLIQYSLTNDEGIFGNKMTASSIAANLQQAGFNQLDKGQMLGLAAAGVGQTATTAEQTAGSELALTGPGGQRLSGTGLSQAELIAANLGGSVTPGGESSGAAQVAEQRAQAGAAARFQSGGTYGSGQSSSTAGYASE